MTTIAPTSLRSRQTAELMVVSTLLELMPLGTPNLSAVIYLDAAGSKDPKCRCRDWEVIWVGQPITFDRGCPPPCRATDDAQFACCRTRI